MKIGIVVARFNEELTDPMAAAAVKTAAKLGYQPVLVRVPGVFDVPYAVVKLLSRKDIAGVATAGAIVKGKTDHDQLIAHTTGHELARLMTRFGKPVTMGIIGPGATYAVAKKRPKEYAVRAVEALDALLKLKL